MDMNDKTRSHFAIVAACGSRKQDGLRLHLYTAVILEVARWEGAEKVHNQMAYVLMVRALVKLLRK